MVLYNWSTKELTAKIVYYGPGLGGKSTNLQWIHDKAPIKNKGKMLSLNTEADRTLFFDFLPIELGLIRGNRTRIQLYTVPGQVFYNATRRMVLKGADAVVFVCDSQEAMLDANLESLDNMRQNLQANEIDPDEIPVVYQYNKRDLPNALPIEILNERLNASNSPFYEAVATRGIGVEDTLKAVTMLVFRSLAERYGDGETSSAPRRPTTTASPTPQRSSTMARPTPPTTVPQPQVARTTPASRSEESFRAAPPSSRPLSAASTLPPIPSEPEVTDSMLDALELEDAPFEVDDIEVEVLPSEEASLRSTSRSPHDPQMTLASSVEETVEIRERLRAQKTPLDVRMPTPSKAAPEPTSTSAAFGSSAHHEITTQPEEQESLSAGAIMGTPVSVELVERTGEHEVVIPVDITLPKGAVEVSLYLRLNLNLRTTKQTE